jgi:hypothetical protein
MLKGNEGADWAAHGSPVVHVSLVDGREAVGRVCVASSGTVSECACAGIGVEARAWDEEPVELELSEWIVCMAVENCQSASCACEAHSQSDEQSHRVCEILREERIEGLHQSA